MFTLAGLHASPIRICTFLACLLTPNQICLVYTLALICNHLNAFSPAHLQDTEQNPDTCLYDCGPNQKCCYDSCCPQIPGTPPLVSDMQINTTTAPAASQSSKNEASLTIPADASQTSSRIELHELPLHTSSAVDNSNQNKF